MLRCQNRPDWEIRLRRFWRRTTVRLVRRSPRASILVRFHPRLIGESSSPRARLRNEAPRSVGVDPQSPAAIRRLPRETPRASDPYKVADTKAAPSAWSAPQLLNTGYTESSPSPPTRHAGVVYSPRDSADRQIRFAPPPWPAPEETAESRTHIVVDGDSLERLASRYLSDPKRSREIYELNRETLSSPDLLPIGAELKIPRAGGFHVLGSAWFSAELGECDTKR